LLVGDISTASISYKDKSIYTLFGDCGTATAIERSEGAPVMHFNMMSDGSGFDAIYIPHSGTRRIADKSSLEMQKFGDGIYRNMIQLFLDGVRVFNFATMEVPPNVKELLESQNMTVEDIDQFVFHQANLLMNEVIRKKLKIPKEKYPYSMNTFGNTSSASIPLTMITQLREKIMNEKLKLLLSGFGVGLSWGSVILETNKIVCSELMKYNFYESFGFIRKNIMITGASSGIGRQAAIELSEKAPGFLLQEKLLKNLMKHLTNYMETAM